MKLYIVLSILFLVSACGKQSKSDLELSSNKIQKSNPEPTRNRTTKVDPDPKSVESKLEELEQVYSCNLEEMTCDKGKLGHYEIEYLLLVQNKLYQEILKRTDKDYYTFGKYTWSDTLTAYLVQSIMSSKEALGKRTQEIKNIFSHQQQKVLEKLRDQTPLKNLTKITYMDVGFTSEYAAIDSALEWLESVDDNIKTLARVQVTRDFEDITLINISNIALLADQYENRLTIYGQFDMESNLELISLKNKIRKKVKAKLDSELSIDSYVSLNWDISLSSKQVVDYNEYRNDIYQIQSSSFINKVSNAIKNNTHMRDFKIALNKPTQQLEDTKIAEGSLYLRVSY